MEETNMGVGLPVVKKMPVAEFRRLGLLQELNRQFLHPLGLALEVVVDDPDLCRCGQLRESEVHQVKSADPDVRFHAHPFEERPERFGGVWDCREDPEGMVFGEPTNPAGAAYVEQLREEHRAARQALLNGRTIQPVDFLWPDPR
jgi:hypothetical protein